MKTIQKENIDEIVKTLEENKIIAIPTDTIYGFSCLADNDDVLQRLYAIKKRDEQKACIILLSKNSDFKSIVKDEKVLEFIEKNIPAPLTMIVEKGDYFRLAKGFSLPTIAIRIPDDEFLQSILDKVGYMISTSCNIQGEPSINDYNEIKIKFPQIDAIVEKEISKASLSSTIIDLTCNPYKVIRQGDYVVNMDN